MLKKKISKEKQSSLLSLNYLENHVSSVPFKITNSILAFLQQAVMFLQNFSQKLAQSLHIHYMN